MRIEARERVPGRWFSVSNTAESSREWLEEIIKRSLGLYTAGEGMARL